MTDAEKVTANVSEAAVQAWEKYAREVLGTSVPEAFPSTKSGFLAGWSAAYPVIEAEIRERLAGEIEAHHPHCSDECPMCGTFDEILSIVRGTA